MGKFFFGMLLLITLALADNVGTGIEKCRDKPFAVNCAKCSRVKCEVCNDSRQPVKGQCSIEPCSVKDCLSCPSSIQVCLHCRPGWKLENNECIINPCIENCKACDTDGTCLNCYEGYVASQDRKVCIQ